MKAFLLSLVALAVVTVGANALLTRVVDDSTAQETASGSVRLPD